MSPDGPKVPPERPFRPAGRVNAGPPQVNFGPSDARNAANWRSRISNAIALGLGRWRQGPPTLPAEGWNAAAPAAQRPRQRANAGRTCYAPLSSRMAQTLAGWQRGYAADCNSVYAGSNPTPASNTNPPQAPRRHRCAARCEGACGRWGVVPGERLELSHGRPYQILSLARLPISPPRQRAADSARNGASVNHVCVPRPPLGWEARRPTPKAPEVIAQSAADAPPPLKRHRPACRSSSRSAP